MAEGERGAVRRPAVAGSFYPGSAVRLAAAVDGLLEEVRRAEQGPVAGAAVRGVVAPHAGYPYSGPVAAVAYAALATAAGGADRVVILGPSHFVPLRGLAVPGDAAWQTPLGEVPIDPAGRAAAVAAGARIDDAVHRSEHSIEVQLPFLQRVLPARPILPVAVGMGDPQAAAALLAPLLTDATVLVVSTDLSHYHDAASARRLDARTAAAVTALDLASLGPDDACGIDALRAGMAWAAASGCRIELLDLRDSSDTAGDPSRVVGYGAFAILAPPP